MKKLLFTLLAIVSLNVSATTYNETTNPALDGVFLDAGQYSIDTTTGLDWLSFKDDGTAYTLGYSINDMASWYYDQGWLVATETQVTNLFNLFFPTFDDSGSTQTITPEDPANLLIQSRNSWILSFGHNASIADDGTVTFPNDSLYSTGMYLNEDGSVGVAGIKIGIVDGPNLATTLYGPDYGISSLTADSAYGNLGVFMVRDSGRHICNPSIEDCPGPVVPIPAAVWLFGSGLLGLLFAARRRA